jgi:hypothetical protein
MSIFSARHIALPVYLMAFSIFASVLLVGYILHENAQHQKDLLQQRTELIQFLRVEARRNPDSVFGGCCPPIRR